MWPSAGIWEPLLRFIGVWILWSWGIIHGKASLSEPVYKMRQGWQRWKPSTTGPSCYNMRLCHLIDPEHRPDHSASQPRSTCSQQIDNSEQKMSATIAGLGFKFTGLKHCAWTSVGYSYAAHAGHSISMETCKYVLTSTLHTQDANYGLTTELWWSHGDVLFIQQFPQDPAILYLGLLYKNTGITFNFINGGTLDERCCWKPATSVCCIHFSAGSTYSSCLMMLIRAASFTDKCVFGRIHHPEWVFLMSHPPACFTLSSIR